MGTVTIGGNARGRAINPTLYKIISAAAARSPYDVQIFSGDRAGSERGSRHNSNNAVDIALVEPGTGTVIPNYKSSTGFPIYAEFAKIAREEQMTIAPDMAGQFRWGGGFSDQDLDLMHFDFKPGGSMMNWTWEGGGRLTPNGEKTVARLGPGKVYYNGERYNAPNTQYASLWGREPLQAPQDAQSAIASLMAPSGGTEVPEMPSPLMGFAPNSPELGSINPLPMPMIASNKTLPIPEPTPSWASGGFGQDAMLGGAMPPIPRPRDPSVLGQQRADQLDEIMFGAGPHRGDFARGRPEGRWMGGGAPDASLVPTPLSRRASGVTPPPPLSPAMPNPTMRPEGRWMEGAGGAPDNPPLPPPRGTPFAPTFPPLYGEQPAPPTPYSPMVAGREEFPGMLPAASRTGDMSAAMGNAPVHAPSADQSIDDFMGAQDSRFLAREMGRNRADMEGYLTPPSPMPSEARMKDDVFSPPSREPWFDAASAPAPKISVTDPYAAQRQPGWSEATAGTSPPPGWHPPAPAPEPSAAFNPPTDEAYRWFNGFSRGYTGQGGAFPEMPLPPAPAVAAAPPQPSMAQQLGIGSIKASSPTMASMQDQFDVSFSPGGPGMIAGLPGAFANRQQPPMTGQDAIGELFGPGAAIGAMPFTSEAQPSMSQQLGIDSIKPTMPSPASWANGMDTYVQNRFPASTFAGGSVVNAPQPGQPGVVQGTMPQSGGPMDIRPPAQGGPQFTPTPPSPPSPRQERQPRNSFGQFVAGGGPIGAIARGIFGGGGLLGQSGSFASNGLLGSSPYNMQMNGQTGQTNWSRGNVTGNPNMQGTMWNRSNGGSVGYVTDPFTGAMIYSASPTAF